MKNNADKNFILGIDTSNYKTSVAVVGLDGEIISDFRELLSVKKGERGLSLLKRLAAERLTAKTEEKFSRQLCLQGRGRRKDHICRYLKRALRRQKA